MEINWWWFTIFGIVTLVLFVALIAKNGWKLDSPLLGLFVTGLFLLALSVLKPGLIKVGDSEISKFASRAEEAKKDAEEAARLALELTAMNVWNEGRYGGAIETDKKKIIIDGIMNKLWDDKSKAKEYVNYMKKQGFWSVSPDERSSITVDENDIKSLKSPLYDQFHLEKSKPE